MDAVERRRERPSRATQEQLPGSCRAVAGDAGRLPCYARKQRLERAAVSQEFPVSALTGVLDGDPHARRSTAHAISSIKLR
jgi:hypothetical protein